MWYVIERTCEMAIVISTIDAHVPIEIPWIEIWFGDDEVILLDNNLSHCYIQACGCKKNKTDEKI